MILVESSFPKETDPSLSFRNVRNLSLSPIMCFEHPLSTYQPRFFIYLVERLCILHCYIDLAFLSMSFSEVLVCDSVEVL
jgi:hypothetical protein